MMSNNEEIRNISFRRKNILYLIENYLSTNGYYKTMESLQTECRISTEYELCDNVDLDTIYLEFASYYHLKFGKYPKIIRQIKQSTAKIEKTVKRKQVKLVTLDKKLDIVEDVHLEVNVKQINSCLCDDNDSREFQALDKEHSIESGVNIHEQLFNTDEWKQLSDVIKSTILKRKIAITWSDVYGNANVIEIVKEAVLTPLNYPKLFANGLKPWKSVLMHGPPGTGKTQLAKVLYAETFGKVTFFNISSSIIISKWRGESEKLIKMLFVLAQRYAPTIIFFDEIESLTSKRDRSTDHESSKRSKNELLQWLDGIEHCTPADGNIFVLAATNMPWEVDEAFLRRFEKKVMVQLPNAVERAQLIQKLLPVQIKVTAEKMETLVSLTDKFSGDEIRLACKELAMEMVRTITRSQASVDVHCIEKAFQAIKPLSVKLMHKFSEWHKENAT